MWAAKNNFFDRSLLKISRFRRQNPVSVDAEDILSLWGALRDYEDDLVGNIKQTLFGGSFFIEDMDFQFRRSPVTRHFTPARFVELLCLDSIGAIYREHDGAEIAVGTGVSVNIGKEAGGELVFLPNVPVRGIRIIVDEDFYRSLRADILSQVFADSGESGATLGTTAHDPELRLVFGQIKRAVEREFRHETYYKNKITEIVYLLARAESVRNSPGENAEHLLPADIVVILERVRNIVETQLSSPPTTAELARSTNVSEAKLHNDFKTAYGRTIHDYSQKVRMAEALRKIENGGEPIYSIARGVGYEHPGHFATVFRNTYGVTPSEYAKLKKSGVLRGSRGSRAPQ
jgi:AraC-like DNA-binding protein